MQKVDNLNLGCDDVIHSDVEFIEGHSLGWVQLQHSSEEFIHLRTE